MAKKSKLNRLIEGLKIFNQYKEVEVIADSTSLGICVNGGFIRVKDEKKLKKLGWQYAHMDDVYIFAWKQNRICKETGWKVYYL